MWRRAAAAASAALGRRPWLLSPCRHSTSSAVDSLLLRSLDKYYFNVFDISPASASSAGNFKLDLPFGELFDEVSEKALSTMRFSPNARYPVEFGHVTSSLHNDAYPILNRTYNNEDIDIFVYRKRGHDFGREDGIDRLRLHVRVKKPEQDDLYIFCLLCPDALRVVSISLSRGPPPLEKLDEKLRDALHSYLGERGINSSLFPFLQLWMCSKDQWKLVMWLKVVATLISLKEEDLPKEDTL